jgi:hypothetical protein
MKKHLYGLRRIAALVAAAGLILSSCGGGGGGGQTGESRAAALDGPATLDSFRGDWLKKPSSNTSAKQINVDSGFYAGNVFVFYEGPGGSGITGSFIIRDRGEVAESRGGFDLEVTGAATTTVGDLNSALKGNWDSASKILFHLSADGQTLTWDLDGSEFEKR